MQSFLIADELRGASLHDLVSLFFGKKAGAVLTACGGSARRVLEEPATYHVGYRQLQAAQEIVRRALLEELEGREVLTSPDAVRAFLTAHCARLRQERFFALWLDSQHRLIVVEELFRGTLAQTSVYPREVVRHALAHNAGAVIFAHNHPSGLAEPSRADEQITQALKGALALIDVRVLDHFVVGGTKVASFAERGLL